MDANRWRKLEEICHAAAEREGTDRAAFLDQACGDDRELREDVESLLAGKTDTGEFLETPVLQQTGLKPKTRVGPYEVLSLIGAGGMGEVYRAHDTVLSRDVALKVLPASLAGDPDRLMRFEREAQALAALNHPNIAQVYGLEQSGETPTIVMELVEGPTLAERITTGPIPLDEALPIARQIAEGLEAAHERGILHRDLKPANIKVREDGTVKLLDFGLAKALAPEPTSAEAAELAISPTLTARATQMGIVLGTAAYMAPEQAKGKPVDKRVDVWAFGVVLFEMLTGHCWHVMSSLRSVSQSGACHA